MGKHGVVVRPLGEAASIILPASVVLLGCGMNADVAAAFGFVPPAEKPGPFVHLAARLAHGRTMEEKQLEEGLYTRASPVLQYVQLSARDGSWSRGMVRGDDVAAVGTASSPWTCLLGARQLSEQGHDLSNLLYCQGDIHYLVRSQRAWRGNSVWC